MKKILKVVLISLLTFALFMLPEAYAERSPGPIATESEVVSGRAAPNEAAELNQLTPRSTEKDYAESEELEAMDVSDTVGEEDEAVDPSAENGDLESGGNSSTSSGSGDSTDKEPASAGTASGLNGSAESGGVKAPSVNSQNKTSSEATGESKATGVNNEVSGADASKGQGTDYNSGNGTSATPAGTSQEAYSKESSASEEGVEEPKVLWHSEGEEVPETGSSESDATNGTPTTIPTKDASSNESNETVNGVESTGKQPQLDDGEKNAANSEASGGELTENEGLDENGQTDSQKPVAEQEPSEDSNLGTLENGSLPSNPMDTEGQSQTPKNTLDTENAQTPQNEDVSGEPSEDSSYTEPQSGTENSDGSDGLEEQVSSESASGQATAQGNQATPQSAPSIEYTEQPKPETQESASTANSVEDLPDESTKNYPFKRNSTVNSPSGFVSPSQPQRSLPESVDIVSDSDEFAPGESFELTAKLNPMNTSALENTIWSATLNGQALEPDETAANKASYTVPNETANGTLTVSVTVPAATVGLTEDMTAKREFSINPNRVAIGIYASTNSENVVKQTDLGFSSEILSGDDYVGDTGRLKDAQYIWTALLGREYLKGKSFGSTYSVYPDKAGTLEVSLSVKLADGTVLKSKPITKQVVDSPVNLAGVSIAPADEGVTDTVMVGAPVRVSQMLSPNGVTNLDEATYEWTATLNGNTILESDSDSGFSFVPEEAGDIEVKLTVTPKDGEPVESNVLTLKATQSGEGGSDVKLLSANISADRNTTNLKAGDEVVLNADVKTEGEEGKVDYKWTATDESGNVLASSAELKDFRISPTAAGVVTVEFTANVSNDLEAQDAQGSEATPQNTNLPENIQEHEANTMAQQEGVAMQPDGASESREEDQTNGKIDYKNLSEKVYLTFLPGQSGLTSESNAGNGSSGGNNLSPSSASNSTNANEPTAQTNPSDTAQGKTLGASKSAYSNNKGVTVVESVGAPNRVYAASVATTPLVKEATSASAVENTQTNTRSGVGLVASGDSGVNAVSSSQSQMTVAENAVADAKNAAAAGRRFHQSNDSNTNFTTDELSLTTRLSGLIGKDILSLPTSIANPTTGVYLTVGQLGLIVLGTVLATLVVTALIRKKFHRNRPRFYF